MTLWPKKFSVTGLIAATGGAGFLGGSGGDRGATTRVGLGGSGGMGVAQEASRPPKNTTNGRHPLKAMVPRTVKFNLSAPPLFLKSVKLARGKAIVENQYGIAFTSSSRQ